MRCLALSLLPLALCAASLSALAAPDAGLLAAARAAGPAQRDLLVGRLQGKGQRRLMLIGRMDTVYWPGILASQPIRQDGNKLYGPGIADDKGGLAVVLHSLAILQAQGWQD